METTVSQRTVTPLREFDHEVMNFLRDHPRSPTLRVAQELMPEIFRMPAQYRALNYAWLSTRLEQLTCTGVLRQEKGEQQTLVWSTPDGA
jgi:hypothetical protein